MRRGREALAAAEWAVARSCFERALEITEPPNGEQPLHVHHTEDEAFWLLEGSATFEVGDHMSEARAGDYVFGPRDIPHRYTTGPDGCRMPFIFTPGGFEDVFRAARDPLRTGTCRNARR